MQAKYEITTLQGGRKVERETVAASSWGGAIRSAMRRQTFRRKGSQREELVIRLQRIS